MYLEKNGVANINSITSSLLGTVSRLGVIFLLLDFLEMDEDERAETGRPPDGGSEMGR